MLRFMIQRSLVALAVAVTVSVASFMLLHLSGDLATAIEDCPRGCGHLGPPADPECALDTAVIDGRLGAGRLAALRQVLVSLRLM